MIARSAQLFTLRSIIDRVGLAPPQRGGSSRRWQRMIAVLEDWWTASHLAWRGEILPGRQTERFQRFCRDCGEDTPQDGSDEFGLGWYAQIYRCRYCGGQSMRIWLV
jgi:hypothetical protein